MKKNYEKEKKAIIEEVKQFEFGEDKNENLAAIKEFQRRWVEVGHVPMVEKDALQKEFRNTINNKCSNCYSNDIDN